MGESKFKKIFKITYLFIMLFYGIYTLIVSVVTYSKYKDANDEFNMMIKNYESEPFYSVYPILY